MTERLVAAAIRREGVVFTGAHHHQIIRYMARTLDIDVVNGEQGFVTSANRFVTRVQAASIAIAAGQVKREKVGVALFSEQLWNLSDYPP